MNEKCLNITQVYDRLVDGELKDLRTYMKGDAMTVFSVKKYLICESTAYRLHSTVSYQLSIASGNV